MTTTTTITPEDVVAMGAKGFFALREDCLTRTELDGIAYEASEQWLEGASEAEREADPTGQAAYERAYEGYVPEARDEDDELYAPVERLLQAAVRDIRLYDGWGVSTGNGRASMRPLYTVETVGEPIVLAPAYPGAYEALRKTPCYA